MLTDLESKMLEFIGAYLRQHGGKAPTLSEVGTGCGVNSVGTVHRYLSSIEDKGYLERARKGWRTRIAPRALPLMGQIAAGVPLEAIENPDSIDLVSIIAQPDCFVLRVDGDSMITRGIYNGDYAIIRRTSSARDGEIVVAVVDGEATLKELKRSAGGRRVHLIPHSESGHEEMVFDASAVEIQGVLSGVVRTDP